MIAENRLHALRKAKLLEIIHREGSQATVARKVGTDKSYLSQIVSPKGSRNVGEALARRIEEAYGQAYGWMDESFDEDEKLPFLDLGELSNEFVPIPRLQVGASLGPGMEAPEAEAINGHLAFKRVWLQKRRLNPKFLTIIDAIGDSMHPTISDGDVLLVDLRQKEPLDNRIFVLRMNRHLYAKRLQFRQQSQIMVLSDNPNSPAFNVESEGDMGLDIIGRVVWAGKDL
ncbi:MAG: LexA family transcriptional regulator [Magnetococcales bacterium]|nr:LexA family transcriptional regulator [Magnetococcales bacterium]